jgi:twitching motility protein PilT
VAEARRGLILVTGATGNGKSTTIAAIINHIMQQERLHVVTVEDPIEFIFSSGKGLVIQREVGADTASYTDALRAALRQDPDVVMVADNLQAVVSLRLLLRADAAGLIPAVEALLATSTVREAIRDGGRVQELRNYMETAGADLGMHSFDQYIYRLHEAKKISLDTALGNATHRADLERRVLIETGGRTA